MTIQELYDYAKKNNMQNAEVAEIELNDTVFGADYNEALIHQVVVAQDANLRQGTKSAVTRREVRGHAKKPGKQKHTGHARQGSKTHCFGFCTFTKTCTKRSCHFGQICFTASKNQRGSKILRCIQV